MAFCHCSFERPLLFLVANPFEQLERLIVPRNPRFLTLVYKYPQWVA
jgi:hypothetical protein